MYEDIHELFESPFTIRQKSWMFVDYFNHLILSNSENDESLLQELNSLCPESTIEDLVRIAYKNNLTLNIDCIKNN